MPSLHRLAGAAMLAGALFAAGGARAQQALTIEQNMAEQRRLHIIPGRQLHVENARGYLIGLQG